MRVILSAAGRAFLRDFAIAFLALASGILAAPNLRQAGALAAAASIAALIAGVRAIRVFVPQIAEGLAGKIADSARCRDGECVIVIDIGGHATERHCWRRRLANILNADTGRDARVPHDRRIHRHANARLAVRVVLKLRCRIDEVREHAEQRGDAIAPTVD